MKKLIILLPLILILILITSCFPTSTPVETDEPEENIIVENGMDSEEDENLNQEENSLV